MWSKRIAPAGPLSFKVKVPNRLRHRTPLLALNANVKGPRRVGTRANVRVVWNLVTLASIWRWPSAATD
jgi:hypothetical protein